jgi:hypothetical protein
MYQSKEDDDTTNGITGIQSGRQNIYSGQTPVKMGILRNCKVQLTVVFAPPAEAALTDDIVEDETDEHPWCIVDRRRRRQCAGTGKDEREIEVLETVHLILLVHYPLDSWCSDTEKEANDEMVVELTVREKTPWSNDTPLSRHR